MKPGLYLVATPIGNIDDITQRAKQTLGEADLILSEDTRETKKLLSNLNIKWKKIISFNDNNEHNKIELVKDALNKDEIVALVSDRGTPLINDPGYLLVKELRKNGYEVIAVPGPAAFISALISSGLPTDNFAFLGFVSNRKKILSQYKNIPATLIFYEAPHRLLKTLKLLQEEYGDREVVVARELTKKFETFYFGTLSNIASKMDIIKGEYVILLAPPVKGEQNFAEEELILIIKRMKLDGISDKVIRKTLEDEYSLNRNYIYDLILKEK